MASRPGVWTARQVIVVFLLSTCLALQKAWAACPSTATCDCGWAEQWGCSNNDGSECWRQCCACEAQGGASNHSTNTPATTPPTHAAEAGWSEGKTTRYWDCCKPSCAWPGKFQAKSPLKVCSARGSALEKGASLQNACGGGGEGGGAAYMCPDQRPSYDKETNTSLLFAAASLLGLTEADWCCACYELVLQEAHSAGQIVVQVTNTGGDLGANHFDLQIPGGGFGIFDSCSSDTSNGPAQFPDTPREAWGSRYGGLLTGGLGAEGCGALPEPLRDGCEWFFARFGGLDNPGMHFRRVACPAKIVEISGCRREDEDVLFPTPVDDDGSDETCSNSTLCNENTTNVTSPELVTGLSGLVGSNRTIGPLDPETTDPAAFETPEATPKQASESDLVSLVPKEAWGPPDEKRGMPLAFTVLP